MWAGALPLVAACSRHVSTSHLSTSHLSTSHLSTSHLSTSHLSTSHLSTVICLLSSVYRHLCAKVGEFVPGVMGHLLCARGDGWSSHIGVRRTQDRREEVCDGW